MAICGIYRIQSIVHPERCYIGSAININQRWRNHLYNLKNSRHNSKLQNHYNKYSKEDLQFSIIEPFEFISKEHLTSREQHYIDVHKPWFNIRNIAESNLGCKHSEESKIKSRGIRKSKKTEFREGSIPWNKGKCGVMPTPWNKGLTKETDIRLEDLGRRSIGNKYGCNAKGKIVSEETRGKMRINCHPPSQKGIKRSEEQKKKRQMSRICGQLEKELNNFINKYVA